MLIMVEESDRNTLSSFMACLGLGMLYAIQSKRIPASAAIWSMGTPGTWQPLLKMSLDPRVIEVFQEADELSALQKLSEPDFEEVLAEMINKLLEVLETTEDPTWRIFWDLGG